MTIYKSNPVDVVIPPVSVTDYVLQHAERLAQKIAFVDGPSGRTMSYGEFARHVRSLPGGLKARGVGPGTTWALMAPNSPEYAVVLDAAHAAAAGAGTEEVIIISVAQNTPFTALFGEPLTAQVPVALDEHIVVLPYSSGTTGLPKGVMLTHKNLVANLAQLAGQLPMSEDEVCYAMLPFFHIYGMQVLMNFMLERGGTIVTVPRFDLEQMLELVQTWKVTRLFVVPPLVLALAKHPLVGNYDTSSVRQIFSGAAPLGGELGEAAAARLNCSIAQGYGMTELSPVTHATREDDYKASSVGTLLAGTEARLFDHDKATDAEQGEPGELWIRGPQVMQGYLNNPEATAQTIDADGWLHTGDVAVIDEDGHTRIVDRLKELIKVKGFQVAPAELEALLVTHEAVADVAIIGVPDEEAGERVRAYVVRVADSDVSAENLKAFVAEHVATYKRVAEVLS